MPEQKTIARARRKERQGKSATSQAGEFVRGAVKKAKRGAGAKSKQAVAIGLSKARRAGVKVPPPAAGKASPRARRKATQDLKAGQANRRRVKGGAAKGKPSRASVSRRKKTGQRKG